LRSATLPSANLIQHFVNNALVKDQLTNIESAAREDANFEKILKFSN
jgi:hypothetical protein